MKELERSPGPWVEGVYLPHGSADGQSAIFSDTRDLPLVVFDDTDAEAPANCKLMAHADALLVMVGKLANALQSHSGNNSLVEEARRLVREATTDDESGTGPIVVISEFVKTLTPDQSDKLIDQLDELVHDAKASEAAAINNSGIEGQAEYLGLDAARIGCPGQAGIVRIGDHISIHPNGDSTMIVNKTTTGFVVQRFDTETRQFISQEFIAADEVDFEDENGQPIDSFDEYLPFEMKQPN